MKKNRFTHYLPLVLLAAAVASSTLGSCKKKDMSLKLNEPRNIKGVVSYKRSFGDLNAKHLEAARAIGIAPLGSRQEAEALKEKLRHIRSNNLYAVDSLTHSIPYLCPAQPTCWTASEAISSIPSPRRG